MNQLLENHGYRESKKISVGAHAIGGSSFTVVAGPCSIESLEQFKQTAQAVKDAGATFLRGGIFKMRTYVDSFQGLGVEAFDIVKEVCRITGMPMVAEVTDPRQIEVMDPFVDVFQVGARNMHNYELLKELGKSKKPILLKRGLSAYLDELLASAEYVIRAGNEDVIFCERGIRSFERATRNTLDLSAVPYLKSKSSLPVLVDPSHGTGQSAWVVPMCLAAAAAGADGLLVEVHPDPTAALSDGQQALDLAAFSNMMNALRRILAAMDRSLQVQ